LIERFVTEAVPPRAARRRAVAAILDTIGVTLAGASEPASRIVQQVVATDGGGSCTVLGTALRTSAGNAALANGTAAHALDFDDMCFVSLAHPSAPLVAALLATCEIASPSTPMAGSALLDAYIVGFEVEARLGRIMNPRHYQRGWHCTATIGTVGAAAAASRLLGLDARSTQHALAIAASSASGLKENFGSMVKPLHAGFAARNGVTAAILAARGMTASPHAVDGPQGFLIAMDSEHTSLDPAIKDLGERWEILDTGIAVKLYPSCAGTHPTIDAILTLRHREGFAGDDVRRIDVDVDSITPTVLIHNRPSSGLEGKFSMPFCAAAAAVYGRVDVDTFEADCLVDPQITSLISRVSMRVDGSFDRVAPPLTQARVSVELRDGRQLVQTAIGARGHPDQPVSDDELAAKFLACARRAVSSATAAAMLGRLQRIDEVGDVRSVIDLLSLSPVSTPNG
jgi:2-methylcitrate dehydratase PrpD